MKESAIKGLVTKLNKQLASLQPGEVLVKKRMHDEVYHRSDGISCSKLKVYIECPAKYRARYITGTIGDKKTKALDVGRAAHTLILEPHKFHGQFVRQPESIKVRRGKAWDEFSQLAAKQGQIVLTGDDWDMCWAMRSQVELNPFGARLLSGGEAEVSFFKRDIETGLIIKCRTDYMLGDLLIDVKTARSAEPGAFGRAAKDLLYHMQDSMYCDITGIETFAFIAVEKVDPYVVTAPILFDEDARRLGYLKYRSALRDLAKSMTFDHWPGYTSKPVTIELKPWESQELETLEGAA